MLTQFPNVIDVLGVPFTVVLVEQEVDAAGRPVQVGQADQLTATIEIDPRVPLAMRPYVLLHEVLHCLTFRGHLQFLRDDQGRDDEGRIDEVASLLAEILMRNKRSNAAPPTNL